MKLEVMDLLAARQGTIHTWYPTASLEHPMPSRNVQSGCDGWWRFGGRRLATHRRWGPPDPLETESSQTLSWDLNCPSLACSKETCQQQIFTVSFNGGSGRDIGGSRLELLHLSQQRFTYSWWKAFLVCCFTVSSVISLMSLRWTSVNHVASSVICVFSSSYEPESNYLKTSLKAIHNDKTTTSRRYKR